MAAKMVAIKHTFLTTDTGTVDITDTELDGQTCTGAIIICTEGVEDSVRDKATLSIGMTDFTDIRHWHGMADESVATTDVDQRPHNTVDDIMVQVRVVTSTRARYDTPTAITNGIRLTVGNAMDNNTDALVILFAGVSCKLKDWRFPSTVGGTTAVTGLGLTPDLIFTMGSENDWDQAGTADVSTGFGICCADLGAYTTPNQCSAGWGNRDAVASVSTIGVHSKVAGVAHCNGSGGDEYLGKIKDIISGGFTCEATAVAGPDVPYMTSLCVDFADEGIQSHVEDVAHPATDTTDTTITGCGFAPEMAIAASVSVASYDTLDGTDSDSFAIGAAHVRGDTGGIAPCFADQDGNGTGDGHSRCGGSVICTATSGSGYTSRGVISSWDADGVTVNWTGVEPLNNPMMLLAIGGAGGNSIRYINF